MTGKLRVGYVPEHFSLPLLQLASSPWGQEHLEIVSQPSGTGQMLTSLESQPEPKLDIAIALTEALIAGLARGRNDYELVGSYVKSSLNWSVVAGTAPEAQAFQSIGDLQGTTLGISRVGSGSQIMASVMALQHGWTDKQGAVEPIQFKGKWNVNDTFEKLRQGVNQREGLEISAFMWEWFTTKPYVDKGEVRFIGSVPTPWPSWTIAASRRLTQSDDLILQKFLGKLADQIKRFTSEEEKAKEAIIHQMKYTPKDVDEWFTSVRWVGDSRPGSGSGQKWLKGQDTKTNEVSEEVIRQTLETLENAGVIAAQGEWELDRFASSHRRIA